uniref:Macro domain-containing protein n=1 Tax=Ornithorhynchus anatinus TaxID=9258 RepID=A0A6I8P5Y5_ORNAN
MRRGKVLERKKFRDAQKITYVKGDLFACPKTDSLAHCISEDCRMGAGIRGPVKKKFGGVAKLRHEPLPYVDNGLCVHPE